ncbi:hypothetical protein [Virgibacillus siamensis]|uniref:hypothetical protein n=1 Tax=Virgibacillus siamensis TaxID=480071 RepID=UPI0009856C82|nr:hypothetical protein [Virgibacillus siamensis]
MRTLRKDFEENCTFFNGHSEAKEWFYANYSEQFVLKGSGKVNGEKIYFYHLITNQDSYKEGIKKLLDKGIVNGLELPMSYYIVGILEDGRVHVMY